MEHAALQEISSVLLELVGAHHELLGVVRSENEALVQADISSVQEASAQKQKTVDRIRRTEAVRVSCMARLARSWKKPSDLSMTSLLQSIREINEEGMPGISAVRQSLESSFETLMRVIPLITQQNTSNQLLVEKSLEHIQSMKRNLLGGSEPASRNYSSEGKKVSSSTSPRFVSREA